MSVRAQQSPSAQAKKYSIIIKGGHVLDPKNNIDAIMDVAIESTPPAPAVAGARRGTRGMSGGKIALIAKHIAASLATQVVDANRSEQHRLGKEWIGRFGSRRSTN